MMAIGLPGLKAQSWYGEGGAGLVYFDESISALLKAGAGYEYNDKWAFAGLLSVGYSDEDGYFQLEPYARYNCWNNGSLYLDCKAGSVFIWQDEIFGWLPNITPAVRCRIDDKWELSLDIAKIGPYLIDGDGYFYGNFLTPRPELSILYRF